MVIWACIATAVAVVLFILLVTYRRQVKKTCRQLVFIKEHDTNMTLQGQELFEELNHLKDEINEVLQQSKQTSRQTKQREQVFKETITNISHDIRTPLTSLDGYFQLLQQSDTEEERRNYIAIIQERIASLNSMLEELFTYTKLQNEQYELELGRIDYSKCVFDTVFSFYEEFKAKNIEPEVDFTEQRCFITGNSEAVKRTLQNVIKNALEHGEGAISLRLYCESDGVIGADGNAGDKGRVVFECANEISNAAEIDVDKVFVRFYKADAARTQTSTGLGLSIAKNLTEKMNGQMEAEVTENTFIIRASFETVEK